MQLSLNKFENWWQCLTYTRPFRFSMWAFRKLVIRGIDPVKRYLIPMRIGHKMELRPTGPYLSRVIINRSYNDENVFAMTQFLRDRPVIIDVGANIGLMACAYAHYHAKLGPTVYAIEAVQKNFEQLERNIRLNGLSNVRPFRLALGKESGEVFFSLPSQDFIGNAVGGNIFTGDGGHAMYQERVPMLTLDQWARDQGLNRCDYIKMDIEGVEIMALKGGKEFIQRTRPVIQCEYNKFYLEAQGLGIQDFLGLLGPWGYDCYVDHRDSYRSLDLGAFDFTLVDLLFVPRR